MKQVGNGSCDERAILAARAVEKLAGWNCRPRCELDAEGLTCLGFEKRRDALLVAATMVPVRAINQTLAEARCDAVVVVASDEPVSPAIAHLALMRAGGIRWYGPCRFWASSLGVLWLIGISELGAGEVAIDLGKTPLRLNPEPFHAPAEASLGFELATEFLSSYMEASR
ncbi:hypothetical protein WJS89_06530 [Sphingomicrobium sp. XHP0235]|uniref:hypothetical protein n=1 Tax=Sphingomicrobium aquimarinum TaxID=3133971 RepID=UPI0031FEF041